jgi:hypothetical protein
MNNFLINQLWPVIIRPVGQRLGTLLGAWLASQNLPAEDVTTITAAVPLIVGVLADLIQRRFY